MPKLFRAAFCDHASSTVGTLTTRGGRCFPTASFYNRKLHFFAPYSSSHAKSRGDLVSIGISWRRGFNTAWSLLVGRFVLLYFFISRLGRLTTYRRS
jgi:hypothetical protein